MSLTHRSKALTLLVIVLAFFSGTSEAQNRNLDLVEDLTLSLDEAINIAMANNPQLRRAVYSIDDADELVKIAYSEIYPDISASMNYTRNVEIPVNFIPETFFDPQNGDPNKLVPVAFGTDNNWQGGFTVSQTLFRGETIIGLSTSTIFKKVQEEAYRATAQQVVTQTRVAYYSVLVAMEQLRLQESQISRLEQNLNENEKRQQAGLVDEYDVLRLKVQLSNQKPQLVDAQYALEEAYRNLKVVLGISLGIEFEVEGQLNQFDILSPDASVKENEKLKKIDQINPFKFQKSYDDMYGLEFDRGDIRILDAQLDLKDREITAVKSRFLPTISATYNMQWTAADAGTPDFFQDKVRFQTLGLNVSLPLFTGFERMANLQRTLISKKDLEEQRRATELNAQNEVVTTGEDINRTFETADARKMALEQAREGYERAKKRFENGLGSQIEVTEAEVQVRQAEANYALMVYQYLAAKAQYDLATGKVPYVDAELIK
mgnify:FL=1